MTHICPTCGQRVHETTPTNANLYDKIAARLAQYGFKEASPTRHQRVMAVRNTIKLRVPDLPTGNTGMPQAVFDAALNVLDEVLPLKEKNKP